MATRTDSFRIFSGRVRHLGVVTFAVTVIAYGAVHVLANSAPEVFATADTMAITPVATESVLGAAAGAILERPAESAASQTNFYSPAARSFDAVLEQQLFTYLNRQRLAAGVPALTLDAGMTAIARTRSQQLIDQGYFAHTDPYGYTMYVELLRLGGYTGQLAGENLAKNDCSWAASAGRAGDALMASPAHRENMLDSTYTRVGIGEVTAADGTHFYAMVFLG